MARIHLFEFEDQRWFPDFLRNYGTDFLQFLANKTKMYRPIVPILLELLSKSGQNKIVDLGSGGGGGWLWLADTLHNEMEGLQITLTDFFPNHKALKHITEQHPVINYIDYPVDARDVPGELTGLRTQFLSLHHFQPRNAQEILQAAVNSGNAIAIFEAQERSIPSFLAMFFSPLTVLLTTPFIKPFSIGRVIFTYLIPMVPLFVWWDGMISSLRTYSINEMNQLINNLKNKGNYSWNVGKIKSGPGVILYLTGFQKDQTNS